MPKRKRLFVPSCDMCQYEEVCADESGKFEIPRRSFDCMLKHYKEKAIQEVYPTDVDALTQQAIKEEAEEIE